MARRTPPDITIQALKRIGELHAAGAGIRGSPEEIRHTVQREKKHPAYVVTVRQDTGADEGASRHPDTAKAFAYLPTPWDTFNLYCGNGWAETDNHLAGNALRGVTLGHKTGCSPVQTAAVSGPLLFTPLSAPVV